MLDIDLAQRELAIVETKYKLEETIEKLKIMEENNSKLHIVIFEIDR
jgi:hypothetical protein